MTISNKLRELSKSKDVKKADELIFDFKNHSEWAMLDLCVGVALQGGRQCTICTLMPPPESLIEEGFQFQRKLKNELTMSW